LHLSSTLGDNGNIKVLSDRVANFLYVIITTTHFTEALLSMIECFVNACNAADEMLIGKQGFPSKLRQPYLNFILQVVPKLREEATHGKKILPDQDESLHARLLKGFLRLATQLLFGAKTYTIALLGHMYEKNCDLPDVFAEFALTLNCIKEKVGVKFASTKRHYKIMDESTSLDRQSVIERILENGC